MQQNREEGRTASAVGKPPPHTLPTKNTTVRIYGTSSADFEDFSAYIKSRPREEVIGWSQARAIGALDNSWVATVSFESVPDKFRDCVENTYGDEESTIIINTPTKTLELAGDAHFRGLTPLNNVGTKDPVADLVAVTGLDGHAFESWTAPDKQHMWLRDYLSDDLNRQGLRVRIMTYGYESKLVGSLSRASIHDYARIFIEDLKVARSVDKEQRRPLVLIGHNLGGLVIKHALSEAAQGSDEDKMIAKSCAGLLFFGVPNRGMDIESLLAIVKGQPNEQLVRDLGPESQVLPMLEREFFRRFEYEDTVVASFYETEDTPTAQVVNGRCLKTGPPVTMVDRYSAVYSSRREDIDDDQLPIKGNNITMVKFDDNNNQDYRTVSERISKIVANAPAVIEKRFKDMQRST